MADLRTTAEERARVRAVSDGLDAGAAMKERPILFSAPMVRALLEGRKTVTRRIVRLPPGCEFDGTKVDSRCVEILASRPDQPSGSRLVPCPYGQPCDRLWVRETFASLDVNGRKSSPRAAHFVVLQDGAQVYRDGAVFAGLPEYSRGAFDGIKWRPSIHMPRWASRILLEVVSVRAERLHEITEEDAKAEGVEPFKLDPEGDCWTNGTHRTAFEYLWNEIHGWAPNSWASNPWVWRVEFRRVREWLQDEGRYHVVVRARRMAEDACDDIDTLLAENAKLNGDLDAIAVAMGLANEHEGHVQRASIERLCEDALAARRAEAMLADVQSCMAKVNAIRNSIVGCQSVNWSEHVYPLAAALDEAGYPGESHETARANVGTLLTRATEAEAENARLLAVAEAARALIAADHLSSTEEAAYRALDAALAALEAP